MHSLYRNESKTTTKSIYPTLGGTRQSIAYNRKKGQTTAKTIDLSHLGVHDAVYSL